MNKKCTLIGIMLCVASLRAMEMPHEKPKPKKDIDLIKEHPNMLFRALYNPGFGDSYLEEATKQGVAVTPELFNYMITHMEVGKGFDRYNCRDIWARRGHIIILNCALKSAQKEKQVPSLRELAQKKATQHFKALPTEQKSRLPRDLYVGCLLGLDHDECEAGMLKLLSFLGNETLAPGELALLNQVGISPVNELSVDRASQLLKKMIQRLPKKEKKHLKRILQTALSTNDLLSQKLLFLRDFAHAIIEKQLANRETYLAFERDGDRVTKQKMHNFILYIRQKPVQDIQEAFAGLSVVKQLPDPQFLKFLQDTPEMTELVKKYCIKQLFKNLFDQEYKEVKEKKEEKCIVS